MVVSVWAGSSRVPAARMSNSDADVVQPHRGQVRPAGNEMARAGAVERGPGMGADRTGAGNCDFHGALRSVRDRAREQETMSSRQNIVYSML